LFGPDVDGDIDAEVTFHLAERIEALRAEGHSVESARAQALTEFGDVHAVRAALRDIDRRVQSRRDRGERLAMAWARLRHSVRMLSRLPGFSLPAVLTLSLGLASSMAIFILLDTIALRPLPYPAADRLVSLSSPMPRLNDTWGMARHQLFYYLANARSIEAMALYRSSRTTLTGDGATQFAEQVPVALVSAGIFDVLGIAPSIGRVLTPDDNLLRTPSRAVLGHELWLRRFGGDRGVVGRTIELEGGVATEVVGVAPPGAQLPGRQVDLWLPDYVDPAASAQNNHVRSAVARLRVGLSAADAERELAPLVLRMEEVFPSAYPNRWIQNSGFRTAVVPLRDDVVGATVVRVLWILFAGVGIVLLVALANVANLFLVRADGRRREMLVRAALGGSRRDLAYLHLTDALVVSLTAAAGAWLLVRLALQALVWLAPPGIPRLDEIQVGGGEAATLLAAALLIGVILGGLTSSASGQDHAMLRDASRGVTLSRQQVAARSALVVAQVALAVVLLAGAGLMLRSFQKLRDIDPGFAPDGVATMDLSLPSARFDNATGVSRWYEELATAVRRIEGVQGVAVVEQLPLTGRSGCTSVVTSQPGSTGRRDQCVSTLHVSPGYFELMRIPLSGSAPGWNDVHRGLAGVVVTRALAEVLWPGEEAIGRTLRCCSVGLGWFRVSGVVERMFDEGLDAPPMQAAFFPLVAPPGAELPWVPRNVHLVVRAPSRPVPELFPLVRAEVARRDAQVPVTNPRALGEVVETSMARRTFTLALLAVASAMALMLSAVGLYAVVSYVVSHRLGEIGIRMALGAGAGRVARMVVRQSMALVALGVGLGVGLAMATTRALGSLLYEVRPNDPLVLGGVALLLVAIAALASLAPTWRATRVDPARALRSEG